MVFKVSKGFDSFSVLEFSTSSDIEISVSLRIAITSEQITIHYIEYEDQGLL